MTLSMDLALGRLVCDGCGISFYDFVFFLVVMRDNASDSEVYELCNRVVTELGY